MPISLHAAFVPTCRQILGSMIGLTETAEAFAADRQIDPDVLLGMRLIADMRPLAFQFQRIVDHSAGAVAATRAGIFRPDFGPPRPSFAEHRAALRQADADLAAVDPAEMEGWIGRPMRFEAPGRGRDFTADEYLLSFAQPNFFFHAATAHDILRVQGLDIGKRAFLGAVREAVA